MPNYAIPKSVAAKRAVYIDCFDGHYSVRSRNRSNYRWASVYRSARTGTWALNLMGEKLGGEFMGHDCGDLRATLFKAANWVARKRKPKFQPLD